MSQDGTARRPTALVTGAGSGIGEGAARRFAQEGWNLALAYMGEAQRPAVDALLRLAEENGAGGVALETDVREDAACRRLVAAAGEAFGGLRAVVNAAGITRIVPMADLDGLSAELFQDIYAVNVIGAFHTARAAAALLRASGNGAVVNLSSYGATTGGGSSIAYAASKGALDTLTRSLARVLAPAVRVNGIRPALIETPFVMGRDPESYARRKERQIAGAPLRKIGYPEDVADTVFWLCTGAGLMTGEILTLDCGLHLEAD
ncbi:MAG: Short-chain dehydrogenase/reductase [Enterovirga sp.]|nr:Short-chain dehydrogenase/reductase [Enterovirga sp.]